MFRALGDSKRKLIFITIFIKVNSDEIIGTEQT